MVDPCANTTTLSLRCVLNLSNVSPVGLPTWEIILGTAPLFAGVLWAWWLAVRHKKTQERRQQDEKLLAVERQKRRDEISALESTPEQQAALLRLASEPRDESTVPLGREQLDKMGRAADTLALLGAVLLGEGAWIVLVVLLKFHPLTDHYALILSASDNRFEMLALLIVRTAAYGTVATTALYVLGRFALASFDQATRFRKRMHSAHVLNALVLRYDTEIRNDVKMNDILKAFRDWNETIESAFSRTEKFGDPRESASAGSGPYFLYGANGAKDMTEPNKTP
jgi:hypothetical protein